MKYLMLTAMLLTIGGGAAAQAPTVWATATLAFDYPVTTGTTGPFQRTVTAAEVQGWTASILVNDTRYVLTDTCVLVDTTTPPVIRCTAPIPFVATAATTARVPDFQATLHDILPTADRPQPIFVAVYLQ
jgi:hypothetical protein